MRWREHGKKLGKIAVLTCLGAITVGMKIAECLIRVATEETHPND